MNKILLVIALMSVSFLTTAQNNENESDSSNVEYNIVVLPYISATSFLENYNSIDFGMMKTLKSGNAIGAEIGYIFDIERLNQSIEADWYNNVSGAKAYFYYRFFIDEMDSYPYNSNTFIDLEAQFFYVNFNPQRIAGYSCNDDFGNCEYYRFYDSKVDQIVPGLNFKIGKLYNYDPFHFTLFAGLGFRYVYEFSEMMQDPLPDKLFNKRGQISDFQTGGMLKLRLGFQVAYDFWK
jgi:hypothetical protein